MHTKHRATQLRVWAGAPRQQPWPRPRGAGRMFRRRCCARLGPDRRCRGRGLSGAVPPGGDDSSGCGARQRRRRQQQQQRQRWRQRERQCTPVVFFFEARVAHVGAPGAGCVRVWRRARGSRAAAAGAVLGAEVEEAGMEEPERRGWTSFFSNAACGGLYRFRCLNRSLGAISRTSLSHAKYISAAKAHERPFPITRAVVTPGPQNRPITRGSQKSEKRLPGWPF